MVHKLSEIVKTQTLLEKFEKKILPIILKNPRLDKPLDKWNNTEHADYLNHVFSTDELDRLKLCLSQSHDSKEMQVRLIKI